MKCLACVQVYLPCALIVVLSWVGFWLNREATSDRVTLGRSQSCTVDDDDDDDDDDVRSDCGTHLVCHLYGQQVGPAQGSLRHRPGLVHNHQFPLLPRLHPGVRWCSLLHQGSQRQSPTPVTLDPCIEHQVGSGETFGNNAVVEEEEEEEEEFIDDLDVDQDWEDVEEWNKPEVPVSIINKWTGAGVPEYPPPPPLTLTLPPRTSYLSARSLYGMSGSLSDSTESLPVQAKLNSLKKNFNLAFHFQPMNPNKVHCSVGLNENPKGNHHIPASLRRQQYADKKRWYFMKNNF